ncbi:MAG: hypothetical protein A2Y69_12805 [Candidatus Aminicenantes bacterium RBG_13_59_9]|nr:MAG: hypothetical protein A2Y69_12805 [Candidatus Aminicenantes bacterium RBG_13_59_9]
MLSGRRSLAEHPDLFLSLDVHGQVVELGHDLIQVLGLDLGEVQVDPFFMQGFVDFSLSRPEIRLIF